MCRSSPSLLLTLFFKLTARTIHWRTMLRARPIDVKASCLRANSFDYIDVSALTRATAGAVDPHLLPCTRVDVDMNYYILTFVDSPGSHQKGQRRVEMLSERPWIVWTAS
ncbi:hypothetical protein SCHPADRAFT_934158, partial [Schizopora paradoxa]